MANFGVYALPDEFIGLFIDKMTGVNLHTGLQNLKQMQEN